MSKSAFTAEQWADIGEAALRLAFEQEGLPPPSDEVVQESRDAAVFIATGDVDK